MKKIIGLAIIAIISFSAPSFAQQKDKNTTREVRHDTKKVAKKTGHKTAELATRGKAKATDRKSDTWVGPQGQTIYVDDGSKYYWINGRGKRIYVSQAALKARQRN